MTKRDVMMLAAGLALGVSVAAVLAQEPPSHALTDTWGPATCAGFDLPMLSISCPDGRRIELMWTPPSAQAIGGVHTFPQDRGEVHWREVRP